MNSLEYTKALIIDKRTYFQYYLSLIKRKQIIIFTFYTKNDYNSRIIKISLFLFSFSLYITINALFFNNSSIHRIYEEKGNYDFIYQIPKILYSTVISATINVLVNYLSLSEKDILKIKKEENNKSQKAKEVLKCLVIKFILFFIFNIVFILFFWYYLSCFCAVFKNTQIHIIKDALISFLLSLIYPFGINLFPGIFRLNALKNSEKNNSYLYNFSKYLQLI